MTSRVIRIDNSFNSCLTVISSARVVDFLVCDANGFQSSRVRPVAKQPKGSVPKGGRGRGGEETEHSESDKKPI